MIITSTLDNLSPADLDRLQEEADLTKKFVELMYLVIDNNKPSGDPEIMNRAFTEIKAIHAADEAKKEATP